MKNKKGFTLVELLAVIVILAILATAAFTLVLPQIEKSRKKSFVSEAANIIDSAELYFLDHPTEESASITDLKPYIKNYDASKAGCVMAPLDEGDNYTIRFSNGDYKTDGTTLYEIGDLKAASGAATDKVVKIDGDHPNFNDGCTLNTDTPLSPDQSSDESTNIVPPPKISYNNNPTNISNRIYNAATKCAEQHVTTYPQDCSNIDKLFNDGLITSNDYTIYLNSNRQCKVSWSADGYLSVSCWGSYIWNHG